MAKIFAQELRPCGMYDVNGWAISSSVSEDEVFWDVIPCQLVDGYQGFGGFCWFHLQGLADQEAYLF